MERQIHIKINTEKNTQILGGYTEKDTKGKRVKYRETHRQKDVYKHQREQRDTERHGYRDGYTEIFHSERETNRKTVRHIKANRQLQFEGHRYRDREKQIR